MNAVLGVIGGEETKAGLMETLENRRDFLVGNLYIHSTSMVKVFIPTPLRSYTGSNDTVLLEGATVREVLRSLTSSYSSLEKHLFTEEGTLRRFVNVYVNDKDIRFLQKENTKVTERDTVSIIPSIAGG